MSRRSPDEIERDFAEAVNMSVAELERWLATGESRRVGWKGRDGKASESVGHASGRRIVAILGKQKRHLDPADHAHMSEVIGFIRRHEPSGPTTSTRRAGGTV